MKSKRLKRQSNKGDYQTASFNLPSTLIKRIDEIADREHRSRSAQTALFLEQAVLRPTTAERAAS